MRYKIIKYRSDIPKHILSQIPRTEVTLYQCCQNVVLDHHKSISLDDLQKYREWNTYNKTPFSKLGHYFTLVSHQEKTQYVIPYHVYFDLQPPKTVHGRVIKYRDICLAIIDWHTINWNQIFDPESVPPVHSAVWPEKNGTFHFTLLGFYMKFPSGLRFYMETSFPPLRYNNALNAGLPCGSKDASGRWIINNMGLWEIVLNTGERYVPMANIKKNEKATINESTTVANPQ